MKQSLLILAAATAVAFAACNGGNNQEGSYTAAQADSIAKAKMDSAQAALKAQNDSTINAKAADEARKADSIRVIDSVIAATKKTTTTTVVKKSNGGKKTTITKKETVTDDPKKESVIDKTSPSYRPGATDATHNKNGTQSKEAPKSVSDRPGAN
ncbi:hypothetical protein [Taibaiella helva]|uniref:hypothetical protein n=1 Tax=Taibaiella helva TaxID=2301235 RepID=UPI000E5784BC|nr:hypothetical protein [Taibaiella helva]